VPDRVRPVLEWLREFGARRANSLIWDERRCLPPYVVLELGNQGLLGYDTPRSLGGLELDLRSSSLVAQQLAAIDMTIAVFVGIHNLLGIGPILASARPEVRDELVPQLASGRILGGLAVTEREAGSNPRAMKSVAVRDQGGWLLTGGKLWIGNGAWAGALNVFTRCQPKPGVTAGVIALIVRAQNPGLRMGPEAMTMGVRAIVQNELFFENARVPDRDVLGEPGRGFEVASASFAAARFGMASVALGGMRRALQVMLRYATRRVVVTGRLLDNAGAIGELSRALHATESVDALVEASIRLRESGKLIPEELSMVFKVTAPELAWQVADRAIQLLGGRGYIETNLLPQLARDLRLLRIFEGPTEALHMHLGSLVDAGRLDPAGFHRNCFGPDTPAEFAEAVLEVKQAPSGLENAAGRMAPHLRRLAIGRVLASSCLAAAAHATRADHPRRELGRAWARAELERARRDALESLTNPRLEPAETLAEVVGGFEDYIGDVSQTLPGMDGSMDPLVIR
jgi:alkylation response protein AidB-like acyl-CoA dehydrogenase